MANLFWRQKGKKTLNLVSTPFASEEHFEKTVFETKEILEDIFLLKRQVRGGRKAGIPDIVGIDSDGNVCIIEMKNVAIDSSVIPQVLSYAFWAKENPDSIRNLWLEAPEQPEDVEVNWDDYGVRIIVIAPSIEPSTLDLVNTITYPVDLIEIKRWVEGGNQFLLVNKLEHEQPKKVRPVRGWEVYDREFYERRRNRDSVKHFLSFAQETNRLVKAKGWPLEMKFSESRCAFKHGFFNAFAIRWIGTKSFALYFNLPRSVVERLQPRGSTMDRYEAEHQRAVYRVDPSRTRARTFLPLFKRALESVTGKHA